MLKQVVVSYLERFTLFVWCHGLDAYKLLEGGAVADNNVCRLL